jgi:D-glycero-D-manno-heptose 1,7-bisphosphate phosphatase
LTHPGKAIKFLRSEPPDIESQNDEASNHFGDPPIQPAVWKDLNNSDFFAISSNLPSDWSKPMKAAVFLDRDGTINEQMGYINHPSRFKLLPRAAAGIRLLNENEIPVVVATNQSGLARGYFPPELLTQVHEKMHRKLAAEGAHVDAIYICPHHPEAKNPEYRLQCDCRKPQTGLLTRAARELALDLGRSYLVGDRWSDLKAAAGCQATGILVLTGYGQGDLAYIGPQEKIQPHYVASDLYEAAQWIIEDLRAGKKKK